MKATLFLNPWALLFEAILYFTQLHCFLWDSSSRLPRCCVIPLNFTSCSPWGPATALSFAPRRPVSRSCCCCRLVLLSRNGFSGACSLLCSTSPPAACFSCEAPLQKPAAGRCFHVISCRLDGVGGEHCTSCCSSPLSRDTQPPRSW